MNLRKHGMFERKLLAPDWPTLLCGIWIAVSPFVLGVTRAVTLWNTVAVGVAIVLLALISGRGSGPVKGLILLLGLWLFISSFVLGLAQIGPLLNNVLMMF